MTVRSCLSRFRSCVFVTLRIVQILSLLVAMGVYADSKWSSFLLLRVKYNLDLVVHGLLTARPELFQIFSGLETSLENHLQDSPKTKHVLEAAIYYVVKFIDYIFKVPAKIYVALACVSALYSK